jgi:hypothetical protein
MFSKSQMDALEALNQKLKEEVDALHLPELFVSMCWQVMAEDPKFDDWRPFGLDHAQDVDCFHGVEDNHLQWMGTSSEDPDNSVMFYLPVACLWDEKWKERELDRLRKVKAEYGERTSRTRNRLAQSKKMIEILQLRELLKKYPEEGVRLETQNATTLRSTDDGTHPAS